MERTPREQQWWETEAALADFAGTNGRRPVESNGGIEQTLARWVRRQRARWGVLTPDKRATLDQNPGFDLGPRRASQLRRIEEIVAWQGAHARMPSPRADGHEGVLGRWLRDLRSRARKGQVSSEVVDRACLRGLIP